MNNSDFCDIFPAENIERKIKELKWKKTPKEFFEEQRIVGF